MTTHLDVLGIVELFGRVGPVMGHVGHSLADEGKGLLLVHVPVQHVQLVHRHAVNGPTDRLDRHVVASCQQKKNKHTSSMARQGEEHSHIQSDKTKFDDHRHVNYSPALNPFLPKGQFLAHINYFN